MSNVEIHEEVMNGQAGDSRLCFHWVTYHFDDGSPSEHGYRFIWRRDDGTLQPARGQARIPTAADLFDLLSRAAAAGWLGVAEQRHSES